VAIPESSVAIPESSVAIPESSVAIPESSVAIPESSVVIPGIVSCSHSWELLQGQVAGGRGPQPPTAPPPKRAPSVAALPLSNRTTRASRSSTRPPGTLHCGTLRGAPPRTGATSRGPAWSPPASESSLLARWEYESYFRISIGGAEIVLVAFYEPIP